MKELLAKNQRPKMQLLCGLLFTAMVCFTLSAQAQIDAYMAEGTDLLLPPIGGSGGAQFHARCAQGQLLTGIELRAGDDIDAVFPICVAAYGPQDVAWRTPYPSVLPGANRQLTCTDYIPYRVPVAPAVIGMYIRSEGKDTKTVNNIHLICGVASADQSDLGRNPRPMRPGAPRPPIVRFDAPDDGYPGPEGEQRCPGGLVAVGIQGRSGVWVDAVGLICGIPELTPVPPADWSGFAALNGPVSLGRVQSSTPAPPPERMGDEPMICAQARSARARNSPVAYDLETACLSAGGSFTDRNVVQAPPNIRARNAVVISHAGITAPPANAPPENVPPAANPPPVPVDPAMQTQLFSPPLFDDGAQLWACVNAAQASKKAGACNGMKAGKAFCLAKGYSGALQQQRDGSPAVTVTPARAGIPVRAANGDVCAAANCAVVRELDCAP